MTQGSTLWVRGRQYDPLQPPQIQREATTTKKVNADRAEFEVEAICSEVMKTEVSGDKILELIYGERRMRDVRDARETRKGVLTFVNGL